MTIYKSSIGETRIHNTLILMIRVKLCRTTPWCPLKRADRAHFVCIHLSPFPIPARISRKPYQEEIRTPACLVSSHFLVVGLVEFWLHRPNFLKRQEARLQEVLLNNAQLRRATTQKVPAPCRRLPARLPIIRSEIGAHPSQRRQTCKKQCEEVT